MTRQSHTNLLNVYKGRLFLDFPRLSTMFRNLLVVVVKFLWVVNAVTIGPTGELVINNKGIAPDGFLRP